MNYQSTNKGKCDSPFFFIFNDLLVIENGSTSLCCGNSELIRVSLGGVSHLKSDNHCQIKPGRLHLKALHVFFIDALEQILEWQLGIMILLDNRHKRQVTGGEFIFAIFH